MRRESVLTKKVDGDAVSYVVHWSAMEKADRHRISGSVPSVPGIYELYYRDDHGVMNRFFVARAWYGGLRNSIREQTDPELVRSDGRKRIIDKYEIFYRYIPVYSFADMTDLLFFFSKTYFPERLRQHSGRYADIFVTEDQPDRIVDIE
jgi:hypothetical protein